MPVEVVKPDTGVQSSTGTSLVSVCAGVEMESMLSTMFVQFKSLDIQVM